MKRSSAGFWIPLAIAFLSFALVLHPVWSQSPGNCKRERSPRARQEKNEFSSALRDGNWFLRYEFVDALGKKRPPVSCHISDTEHRGLKDSLGCFLCTDQERKERTSRKLHACLDGQEIVNLARSNPKAFVDYLASRGLRRTQDAFIPDYVGLAKRAARTLEPCAQAMGGELGDAKGDWLAFFQALRPDENDESLKVQEEEAVAGRRKWTGGLLVPTDVLIQNRGDCDSKALALFALQQDPREAWVLFRATKLVCSGDGHAFLAFEQWSHPGYSRRFDVGEVLAEERLIDSHAFEGNVLKIGLLTYTVMDVTGPGKTRLGELDEEKYGLYIGIPLSSGRP